MDLIVQKGTELGVSKIVPLISERTVVQLAPEEADKKAEKWRQIVVEAGKQCGQSRLPEVIPPVTPKHFFAELDQYEMALIASLQADARSFKSALSDFREQHGRRPKNALVLIGPEGTSLRPKLRWPKAPVAYQFPWDRSCCVPRPPPFTA